MSIDKFFGVSEFRSWTNWISEFVCILMLIEKFFGVSEFRSRTNWIFSPIFCTSLAVPETFPILSNVSSHGPGNYVKLSQRCAVRDFSWSMRHG